MFRNMFLTLFASNSALYLFFSFANWSWLTVDMIAGWDSASRALAGAAWLWIVGASAIVCAAGSDK